MRALLLADHGQLQIFLCKLNDDIAVVGSSNFTPYGLTHNSELNLVRKAPERHLGVELVEHELYRETVPLTVLEQIKREDVQLLAYEFLSAT